MRNDMTRFISSTRGCLQWLNPEFFRKLMQEILMIHAKVDKLLKCACKCDEKEIKEVVAAINGFTFPDIDSTEPVILKV